MRGILKLAYKLLVNDKAKFTALLVGITFAVFLMIAMTSLFAGVLNRASATVINLGASMWIMDPAVQTVANTIGMPDYVLDATRSMQGVDYAVPVYSGGALVKLADGIYQAVTVVGLDDTSLFGRPRLIAGKNRRHLRRERFHCRQGSRISQAGNPGIGNGIRGERTPRRDCGHRAGCQQRPVRRSHALHHLRKSASIYPESALHHLLCSGRSPRIPPTCPTSSEQVQALGYLALTKDEFMDKISDFYMFQTGLGMNLLIMTVMSFIVGLSISGQTFYTFVLENLEKFGALKAMGAKSRELILMILFQASFTALTGYGLGIGLCALTIALAKMRLPDYAAMITYWNLGLAFVMVVIIAAVSSYFGVRKVLRIEPFDIFRG